MVPSESNKADSLAFPARVGFLRLLLLALPVASVLAIVWVVISSSVLPTRPVIEPPSTMPIHLAGFRIPRYAPDGSLAAMVAGASAVLRDEMLFEIVRPRVKWMSGGADSADLMTFDAGSGNYDKLSGIATLTGGVTVAGSDGTGLGWLLTCDDLAIETRSGSFTIDGAVKMSREGFRLSGRGMTGRVDPLSRSLRLVSIKSGVRAELDPRSVRQ